MTVLMPRLRYDRQRRRLVGPLTYHAEVCRGAFYVWPGMACVSCGYDEQGEA